MVQSQVMPTFRPVVVTIPSTARCVPYPQPRSYVWHVAPGQLLRQPPQHAGNPEQWPPVVRHTAVAPRAPQPPLAPVPEPPRFAPQGAPASLVGADASPDSWELDSDVESAASVAGTAKYVDSEGETVPASCEHDGLDMGPEPEVVRVSEEVEPVHAKPLLLLPEGPQLLAPGSEGWPSSPSRSLRALPASGSAAADGA